MNSELSFKVVEFSDSYSSYFKQDHRSTTTRLEGSRLSTWYSKNAFSLYSPFQIFM